EGRLPPYRRHTSRPGEPLADGGRQVVPGRGIVKLDRHTHGAYALILLIPAIALMLYDPRLYAIVAVHLFAIPAIAYPSVYRQSPWEDGPTGKALMNKARAVALLFFIAVLGFWWPFPGYLYIYGAIITYLGCAITYQFVVMLRLKTLAHLENEP